MILRGCGRARAPPPPAPPPVRMRYVAGVVAPLILPVVIETRVPHACSLPSDTAIRMQIQPLLVLWLCQLGAVCQATSGGAVLSAPTKDVRLTRAVLEARRYLHLLCRILPGPPRWSLFTS